MKYLFNQDKLDIICKEITELETNEIHKSNDFYGQAHCTKSYIGLNRSLKFIHEHGIMVHDDIWKGDLVNYFKVACLTSNYRKKVYQKKTNYPLIFNIGSGFLYAKKTLDKKLKPVDRQGTLVFLNHSSHHIKADYDLNLVINHLKQLPQEFHPITVSIYWKDYQHSTHKIFIDNGFDVVSAGHIYDKSFLYNLYDIVRNFKYAASSSLGSHVFYSIIAGCQFFRLPDLETSYIDPKKEAVISKDNEEINRITKEFVNTFIINTLIDKKLEIDFVKQYARTTPYSKTRLIVLIVFAEIIYLLTKFHRIGFKILKLVKIKLSKIK